MDTNIKYEKYRLKRGFNQEDEKEFDQVLGFCSHMETKNNIEYQERLFNVIRSIVNNDSLDYISKLEKLNILITTNKSLIVYKEYWDNQYKTTFG